MVKNNNEEDEFLKPICDLMGQTFTIPHYQRGYRWEDQEVTELLDDLWAFSKDKDKRSDNFYCLQPIVLRQNKKGNYDVLDGQQRLTTLYLILVYLEEKVKEQYPTYKMFTLNYATRKGCEVFLTAKKFTNGDIDSSNIDFYHICKAYKCIAGWFEDNPVAKGKLHNILLDKSGEDRNVRVIHYVEKGNPIEVFIRLNIGKIPLTDAELTKALLLQSDKYSQNELEFNKMKLHNIANEWDNIETALHNKLFWGFLNDKTNEKSAHIEFIFDMLANKIYAEKKYFITKPKKYATFLIFSKYLQDLIDNGIDGDKKSRIEAVEKIWKEITDYFEYFKEWFQNRKLYHYIGFLIAIRGYSIIDSLIMEAKQIFKPEFIEHLEKSIAKIIKTGKPLKDLIYEDEEGNRVDTLAIKRILLLHNVYTTLNSKNENPLFPFYLYNEHEWSLEHIHARKSESLTDTEKQKEWLYDHINSLNNLKDDDSKELINKMEIMTKEDDIDNDEFNNIEEEVYEKIKEYYEFENEENVHSIKNLCLLDEDTNSMLNNSVFDVKREKIRKREKNGCFIPICTRNVFLKAYTASFATSAYWTKTDRNDYFKDIEDTYNYFVTKLEV
jgi:hypothetical protein